MSQATTAGSDLPNSQSAAAPPVRSVAPDEVDALAINTIRFLAADGVQAANSGHPGMPMGSAAMAWTLWSRFLRHDPSTPDWADRDRFVLSAGHGSMLLYSLLHLFGYDLPLDELRRFRQWGSKTPGHPEYGHTPGVEVTTGPLGAGIATAVGLALGERMRAARANTDEHTVVDHRTWVICGDGDLMEGISHEAASLAGHLGLGRLIVLWDDNNVTIDGPARQSCTDDTLARFAAYGWQTLRVADGNDVEALTSAMTEAAADDTRPTLVSVRTVIGDGAPTMAGTSKVHGSPLGEGELAAAKEAAGWPAESFHIPSQVAQRCQELAEHGKAERLSWAQTREAWELANPELAVGWDTAGQPPADLAKLLPVFESGTSLATREASGATLAAIGPAFPGLVGGSADLAASTNTTIPGSSAVSFESYAGRMVHFGIREHAMGAMLNGLTLHGGLRAYGSTFLVFADYLRPAVRLAALMGVPSVFVLTHDSIMVGEDGPTHQPIEHLESLRLIPNVTVLRPADANETAACWQTALEHQDGPCVLALSRQKLPVLEPVEQGAIARDGARILRDGGEQPDVVLAATGSEVSLALAAADELAERGVAARVLSVPWRERFEQRLADGSDLLPDCPAVWIEAGVPHGWQALARSQDTVIGLRRFGASAPGPTVYAELGFTVPAVVDAAMSCIAAGPKG